MFFNITGDLNVELGMMCTHEKDIEVRKGKRNGFCAQTTRRKEARMEITVGPRGRDDDAYIYNDVKLWDTWDHYPIYARIQEGQSAEQILKRRGRKSGQDGNQRQMSKKGIQEKGDAGWRRQDLASIQKTIEIAAGNSERVKFYDKHQTM